MARPLLPAASSPRRWADRLVGSLDPAVREALAREPKSAIEAHLGLRVIENDALGERGNGGWCDGLSIIDEGVIFYAPTSNSKRQNFTLGHEVAHYLVDADTDEATLDWVADLPDGAQVIEQVCNLVASRLLVPESLVGAVLADFGYGGSAVAELFEKSKASREVCAIALSERLPCDGFVALVNRDDHRVTFASRAHEGRPYPCRGDAVPAGHPLLGIGDGDTAAAESWWPWPDGGRQTFYQHAFRDGRWVYAVLSANDRWQVTQFHPAPAERLTTTFPERAISCPCGYTGMARGFPCPTCHEISCPECHDCDCDRKERVPRDFCQHCWQKVPVDQLDEDKYCTGCR